MSEAQHANMYDNVGMRHSATWARTWAHNNVQRYAQSSGAFRRTLGSHGGYKHSWEASGYDFGTWSCGLRNVWTHVTTRKC